MPAPCPRRPPPRLSCPVSRSPPRRPSGSGRRAGSAASAAACSSASRTDARSAVKGDPDSPVNKGLACVKGYYSVEASTGATGSRRAMVRREGALVPVPARRGARPGGPEAPGGHRAARQGERRPLRIAPSGPSPTPTSRRSCSRAALGNEQPGDQRPRLYAASAMAGLEDSSASTARSAATRTSTTPTPSCSGTPTSPRPTRSSSPGCWTGGAPTRRSAIIDLSTRTTRTSYAADRTAALRCRMRALDDRQRHLPGDRDRAAVGRPRVRESLTSPSSASRTGLGYGLTRGRPI